MAVRADTYDIGEEFRDLIDNGVEVREISFKEVPPEDVNNANYFQGRNIDLQSRTYWLMEDGQNNCADSDLWLVVSYSVEYPIAPIRPTLIFATDFIQRYVPDIIWPPRPGEGDAEALAFLRQSDGVLATTPHTRLDAISYAGLPASKVYLAPMEFDPTFWIVTGQCLRLRNPISFGQPTQMLTKPCKSVSSARPILRQTKG